MSLRVAARALPYLVAAAWLTLATCPLLAQQGERCMSAVDWSRAVYRAPAELPAPRSAPNSFTGGVRGVVIDGTTGSAVAEAFVKLIPRDSSSANRAHSTMSDASGAFEFRGIRPGAYTMRGVYPLTYRLTTSAVEVRAGWVDTVRLALVRRDSISFACLWTELTDGGHLAQHLDVEMAGARETGRGRDFSVESPAFRAIVLHNTGGADVLRLQLHGIDWYLVRKTTSAVTHWYAPERRVVRSDSLPVPASVADDLGRRFDDNAFWTIPARVCRGGLDGFTVILEARVAERYHVVPCWVPWHQDRKEIAALHNAMLELERRYFGERREP